jgi:hypothetical protein
MKEKTKESEQGKIDEMCEQIFGQDHSAVPTTDEQRAYAELRKCSPQQILTAWRGMADPAESPAKLLSRVRCSDHIVGWVDWVEAEFSIKGWEGEGREKIIDEMFAAYEKYHELVPENQKSEDAWRRIACGVAFESELMRREGLSENQKAKVPEMTSAVFWPSDKPIANANYRALRKRTPEAILEAAKTLKNIGNDELACAVVGNEVEQKTKDEKLAIVGRWMKAEWTTYAKAKTKQPTTFLRITPKLHGNMSGAMGNYDPEDGVMGSEAIRRSFDSDAMLDATLKGHGVGKTFRFRDLDTGALPFKDIESNLKKFDAILTEWFGKADEPKDEAGISKAAKKEAEKAAEQVPEDFCRYMALVSDETEGPARAHALDNFIILTNFSNKLSELSPPFAQLFLNVNAETPSESKWKEQFDADGFARMIWLHKKWKPHFNAYKEAIVARGRNPAPPVVAVDLDDKGKDPESPRRRH